MILPLNRPALPLTSIGTIMLCAAVVTATAGCSRGVAPASAEPRSDAAVAAAGARGGEADTLARGEYLVRMGGCNDCHTPGWNESGGTLPTSQWLVGSPLGNHGPWGTTYPANLRLKLANMDEAGWMQYSANLHTRPLMPDFTLRAMHEDDRRALYRFVHSLGPAGQPAPAYLPPGATPPPPYLDLVLPPPQPPAPTGT
jgi:mono/diheme cytochrome c family protein